MGFRQSGIGLVLYDEARKKWAWQARQVLWLKRANRLMLYCSDCYNFMTADVKMLDDDIAVGIDKFGNFWAVNYDAAEDIHNSNRLLLQSRLDFPNTRNLLPSHCFSVGEMCLKMKVRW